MLYIMILAGILLFLRIEEVLGMKIDHFVMEFQIFDNNGDVKVLNVKVKGKADKDWVHLNIYRDDERPEFCLLTHLLIWVELMGIKDGHLFPHPDDFYKYTGGHFPRGCEYTWFLNYMKHLVFNICGRKIEDLKDKFIIGTHLLRKTGYLWAMFGCHFKFDAQNKLSNSMVDMSQIQLSARHQDAKCIAKYSQDAGTTFAMLEADGSLEENRVSPWKPIHVLNSSTARSITSRSTPWQRPLPTLGTIFTRQRLGIHPSIPNSVPDFVDKAMKFRQERAVAGNELDRQILRHIPESEQANFRQALEEHCQARFRYTLISLPPSAVSPTGSPPPDSNAPLQPIAIPSPDAFTFTSPTVPPQLTRSPTVTGGLTVAPSRPTEKGIIKAQRASFVKRNASSEVQIEALIQAKEIVNDEVSRLDAGDKRFFRRVMRIYDCFDTCCQGDIEIFVRKYPGHLHHTNFQCVDGKPHVYSVPDN
jgi:hypothetical protein